MTMEEPVGGVGREIPGAIPEELFNSLSQGMAGDGVAGRAPPVEERSARDHGQRRLVGIGLADEVPHARMAERIGVWIAGEEVGNDVVGQVPGACLPPRLPDREIDGGQVAGVVASPRADRKENDIPRLDDNVGKRADGDHAVALALPRGEAHDRAAAPHLHHPGDAVAAGGVGMLHGGVDRHRGRHRALPGENGAERRRGMDGEAVGLHRPRHLHRLIRRIGDHRKGIGSAPPLHKRIVGVRFHPSLDPPLELHSPLPHPEVGQPGREDRPVDPLSGDEGIELGVVEGPVGGSTFDPGHEREDLGGGVDEHRAPRRQSGHEAAQIGQEEIRTPRGDNPRRLEDRHVTGATVTGITSGKPHRDRSLRAPLRQLDADLAPLGQRRDGRLPSFRPIAFADVADRVEGPQRRLPRLDHPREMIGIPRPPLAPRGPDRVERQGGRGIDKRRDERREVSRAHAMLRGSLCGRDRAGEEPVPLGQRRGQALHQRRPAAGIGVEGDPLEVDACGAGVDGVARVDVADAGEGLLRPVALRRRRAEADTGRREDGMGGDLLRRVEILVNHLRRHHQRLPDVREALPRGAVDRKLLTRIERGDPGQIADTGGVFGVREPAQHDRPRITRRPRRDREQLATDRAPHGRQLLLARLRGVVRWHRPTPQLVCDELPRAGFGGDIGGAGKPLEIDIGRLVGGRMTFEAIAGDERTDVVMEAVGHSS